MQAPRLVSQFDATFLIGSSVPTGSEIRGPAPVSLVAVLDCSSSMAGDKMEGCKNTMSAIIEALTENDHLGIVTFTSEARVAMSLTQMNDVGRESAKQAVKTLNASGGTNIHQALITGFETIAAVKEKSAVSAVLLLTDGEDFSGKRVDEMCDLVSNARSEHLYPPQLHTFGYGLSAPSALLVDLAREGDGQFVSVDDNTDLDDLRRRFLRLQSNLTLTTTLDMTIGFTLKNGELHCDPQCGGLPYTVFPPKPFTKCEVRVNDARAGDQRAIMLTINRTDDNKETTIELMATYFDVLDGTMKKDAQVYIYPAGNAGAGNPGVIQVGLIGQKLQSVLPVVIQDVLQLAENQQMSEAAEQIDLYLPTCEKILPLASSAVDYAIFKKLVDTLTAAKSALKIFSSGGKQKLQVLATAATAQRGAGY